MVIEEKEFRSSRSSRNNRRSDRFFSAGVTAGRFAPSPTSSASDSSLNSCNSLDSFSSRFSEELTEGNGENYNSPPATGNLFGSVPVRLSSGRSLRFLLFNPSIFVAFCVLSASRIMDRRLLFTEEFDNRVNRLPGIFLKNDHVRTLTDLNPSSIGRRG